MNYRRPNESHSRIDKCPEAPLGLSLVKLNVKYSINIQTHYLLLKDMKDKDFLIVNCSRIFFKV